MSLHVLSSLIAGILILGIGGSVLIRDRHTRRYSTFTVVCINLSLWYLSHFLARYVDQRQVTWLSLLIATALPLNAERFFRVFLAEDPRHLAPVSRSVVVGTVAVVSLLLIDLFFPFAKPWMVRGPVFAFVFCFLGYCMFLIRQRERALMARPGAARLRYLYYGGLVVLIFSALDFIETLGVPISTLSNLLTIVYVYFFSQTLFQYRLLDIKELLAKIVTLILLMLLFTIIYGGLLVWVGSGRPSLFFFNTLVASFFVLVLSEPLRNLFENRINRWLFAERHELDQRLRTLRTELANLIDVPTAVQRILEELERSARVTHASIYLADPSGTAFRLERHFGPRPVDTVDATRRRLFFDRLRQGEVLSGEGLERELEFQLSKGNEDAAAATRNILEAMEEVFAAITFPLMADGQLLGFLNLRDERMREAYASNDLENLRSVAAQAAITLRNSEIYEQMKERDRLAALGQMAAGLAHELRNPLGAIKGAAQLLKTDPQREEKEGRSETAAAALSADFNDYLDIIVEEVGRLDHVLTQFLGYARPDRGERELVNINELLRKSVQMLRSQAPELDIQTNFGADLPSLRVDPLQIHQVFLNLGINAIQAMDGKGLLEITTRRRYSVRRAQWTQIAEIQFRDTGKGIAADRLSDIFIPFFTTKEQGTGLGLPICQRIVENHQGRLEVRSQLGVGSVFTVSLPVPPDTTQA